MSMFRARGLKIVTLVVAMLAAIGSWELYKGIARPTAKAEAWAVFDHFKCYLIATSPVDRTYTLPRKVRLQNQFGTETATVITELMMCTPAAKEDLGPLVP